MAGWEFRFGALSGGLPVRVFRQVAICKVVPLGLTGVRYVVSTLRNSSSYVGDLNVLQIGDLSPPDSGGGHLGHVRSPRLKLTLLKCRCHLVIRLTPRI